MKDVIIAWSCPQAQQANLESEQSREHISVIMTG